MTEESAELPLYRWQEIARDITEQIRSGRLPVGARLPVERLLCEEYGAALGTVRRAVRELREQGLIGSVPARGRTCSGSRQGMTKPRQRRADGVR
nr:winged helix-turn-helix domain-containing protein [Streptomyces hygroscopicus]